MHWLFVVLDKKCSRL